MKRNNPTTRTKVLGLALLAVIAGVLVQEGLGRVREKRAAERRQEYTVHKSNAEIRARDVQVLVSEQERMIRRRRLQEGLGDHWLPGELDRLRKRRPGAWTGG